MTCGHGRLPLRLYPTRPIALNANSSSSHGSGSQPRRQSVMSRGWRFTGRQCEPRLPAVSPVSAACRTCGVQPLWRRRRLPDPGIAYSATPMAPPRNHQHPRSPGDRRRGAAHQRRPRAFYEIPAACGLPGVACLRPPRSRGLLAGSPSRPIELPLAQSTCLVGAESRPNRRHQVTASSTRSTPALFRCRQASSSSCRTAHPL